MTFDEFKTLGENLINRLKNVHSSLDYDEQSIEWLDGYIDRNRHLVSEDGRYEVAVAFGFILGETIIRHIGGQWKFDEDRSEWIVDLGSNIGHANPIAKADKSLEDVFDNLHGMYSTTQLVVEHGGWDVFNQNPDLDPDSGSVGG